MYIFLNICPVLENIGARLSEIQGPYAFIYYSKKLGRFIYGRDPFGRRSLLAIYSFNKLVGFTSGFISHINKISLNNCVPLI